MKKVTVIAILMTSVLLLTLIVTSAFSWFENEIEEAYYLDVDASGVLFLYIESSTQDPMGDEDRYMYPAVAMEGAVANGLYMNPMVEYNSVDANPSYVQKTAVSVTYETDFMLQQAEGSACRISYSISAQKDVDEDSATFSMTEFVLEDVRFEYTVQTVEVIEYPVFDGSGQPALDLEGNQISYTETIYGTKRENAMENGQQNQDKTSGSFVVESAQRIYFTMTVHLANVDELMDSELINSPIWFKLSCRAGEYTGGE